MAANIQSYTAISLQESKLDDREEDMTVTTADKIRFERITREYIMSEHIRENIGTYKEKRLHAILKLFMDEDISHHEIKCGPFVADILSDNQIIEIQTGSFYPMQKKIRYYLEETDCNILVVRPLPHIKHILWISPESGEITSRRRSPRKTLPKDVLRDWYYLREFIGNPRFQLKFLLLEEEEYRLLCGWSYDRKRGSQRYERIPISLLGEETFKSKEDYRAFLPDKLPPKFKASEYMKLTKLGSFAAYSALKLLCELGLIEKGEKLGRGYIYRKI